MTEDWGPLPTRRAFFRPLLALLVIAAVGAPMRASTADGASAKIVAKAEGTPAGLGDVDALLAKVKAEHPHAQILKVELLSGEAGGADWLYEVKLFPPDGRIMKLVYDARTLALLEAIGGGRDGGGPRHMRLRRGW